MFFGTFGNIILVRNYNILIISFVRLHLRCSEEINCDDRLNTPIKECEESIFPPSIPHSFSPLSLLHHFLVLVPFLTFVVSGVKPC